MSDESGDEPAAVVEAGNGKWHRPEPVEHGESYCSSNGKEREIDGEGEDMVEEEVLEAEPVVEDGKAASLVDSGEVRKVDGEGEGMVEVKGDELREEGERKREFGGVLEGEEDKGAEMIEPEDGSRCKKKVGAGKCKTLVKNGEEFCVKHLRRGSKSNRSEEDKQSELVIEEEGMGFQVLTEKDVNHDNSNEKGEAETTIMEEDVDKGPRKRGRKRKDGEKESDGSGLGVGGLGEALGGRTGLRIRKPPLDSRLDEASAGKTATGRISRRDPKYLEEISENCHQCQRHDKGGVIRCKHCKTKRYCFPCANRWYPHLSDVEIANFCPFCRKNCNLTV